MIRIVSPHLDDAVLSLGQYMTISRPEVVTVFAGVPTQGLSDYDRSCGFESSQEAMRDRRAEDDKACAELGATTLHLDFLDGQYAKKPRTAIDKVTNALRALPEAPTFIPLGIGHPDHVFVSDAALLAFAEYETVLAYEELPYRVLRPEEVAARLEELKARGYILEQYLPDQGPRDVKEAAIACYRSQFPNGADDPTLICPERCWRVQCA